jgi:tetratricopeptide (TPR) repeat protein
MVRNTFVLIFLAILLWPLFSEYVWAAPPDQQNDTVKQLIDAEHWKRARAVLDPQFDAHPEDAQTLYLLAQVKVAFNKLDEALTLAQRAVALDDKNSYYHLELGIVYGELASKASFLSAHSLAIKFRKEVELAIELDPSNLEALYAMMQFKYRAPAIIGGSKEEARALALRICHLDAHRGYLF